MQESRYKIVDSMAQLDDGQILVAGSGRTVEVFDPKAGNFMLSEGTVDAARFYVTTTKLMNGQVLILGGYDAGIRATNGASL